MQSTAKPYPWIIGPVVDFIFVYGGGPLLLFAANFWLLGWVVPQDITAGQQRFLLTLVLLGQHFFADAHNSATYMRIWGSEEDQARFRFYRTWLVYISVALFCIGLIFPAATSTFVYLYFITVYWHYAAQTFGISLIYCYKRGYTLTAIERKIYKGFILSMSAVVIVRLMSFREMSPEVWFGVPLPFWGPLPSFCYLAARVIFGGYAAAFLFVILRKLIRDKAAFPMPSMVLVSTVIALGLSVGTTNAMLWFYVPAFFHGSQYLAVCLSYYLKERGLPEGTTVSEMSRLLLTVPAVRYVALVFVSGTFFYIAIPTIFLQLGFNYALVAGLVLATVNFHHFVTDAAIWRLRDPRCREILLA